MFTRASSSRGDVSSTAYSCVFRRFLLGCRRVLPDLRLDGILEHSPAERVRRPAVPAESPTLGFTHLQFEALLTAARQSPNSCDFALVAMLGLLGLRIFEATGADIGDLGEEHGHRVLRVCGKGTKIVLVPLPPAVGRAIDRATGSRTRGPVLLNSRGPRMDRHAATRRLRHLATTAGVQVTRAHPHMLRHKFVTTMQAREPVHVVSQRLGHASPMVTLTVYAHVMPGNQRETANTFARLIREAKGA